MDTKPTISNFLIVILPTIFVLYLLLFVMPKVRENRENSPEITSFQECVDGGNPVMESYPRQCAVGGKTFTEIIEYPSSMSESEARIIAEKECIKGGEALEKGTYNENSKTWWFDANLNSVKEGCNPACVVSEETKTAEINWRCTGLVITEV